MKTYTENQLKGKFVIAYDSIVNGNQCVMFGEEGELDYGPLLFNSADEAFTEIFYANLSMLKSHMDSDQLEELNEGVTPELIQEMGYILQSKDVVAMRKFMQENPAFNDYGEWVERADKFILNRKFIFIENGGKVTGKKLYDL